ncbi:hypothetical protein ACTWPT_45895 [Nonomuraea sp. 3N208]|uniref:hypothetical protein n=1 Tax=Nonomuraea sp. 3N208 TaxID=3457421 RepID=UPI003FD03AA2
MTDRGSATALRQLRDIGVVVQAGAAHGIADVEAWLRHALAFLEPRGEVRTTYFG